MDVLRIAVLICIPAFSLWSYHSQSHFFQLGMILKTSRDYCRRLELAALDFVCIEEVTEVIDRSKDEKAPTGSIQPPPDPAWRSGSYSRPLNLNNSFSTRSTGRTKVENIVINDYQFVRQAGEVKENRVLLELNGKKARPKETVPKTQAFQYSDILLAPIRLLDERFEEYYSFHLLGQETAGGVEAWILEVAPRLTSASPYLGAKVWIKTEDSSVVRIEWNPSTFGHYDAILARAESYKAEPEVRSYTEFGVEKNGLRFPSVDFTEEAYRAADGKLFVRAKTGIIYRAYKFFTVETKTAIK